MKSKKLLEGFTAYCKANPDERFWQALCNWSRYTFIYGQIHGEGTVHITTAVDERGRVVDLEDTFYIED